MSEPEKDLNTLSLLIDDALNAAVQMEETSSIFLLSMASLDVSQKIDAANLACPTAPSDDTE
jgi:hypothetical protein